MVWILYGFMWSQGLDSMNSVDHFQLRIFSDKLKEMQRNMFKYTCPNYFKSLYGQLKISRKWEKNTLKSKFQYSKQDRPPQKTDFNV